MSLTTIISTKYNVEQVGANDIGSITFDINKQYKDSLDSGTGSSQADLVFADTRTLTASATEDLDLAGTLIDALGDTLTFVKVKAIYIKAADANTNNVEITPASSNGFLGPFNAAADQVDLPPGGSLNVTAPVSGWTVTAGTGDLITITNSSSGTGVTYDVIIIGTSA
jgi:hypothetical protein